MEKTEKKSKALTIVLLIVQLLIAISMWWAASMKLFQSPEKLAQMWPWTASHEVLVKVTGIIDLLGGIGIIIPTLFKSKPKLVVISAWAIVVLMIYASVFHISRGEASQIGINIVFAFLAGFVAWGRNN